MKTSKLGGSRAPLHHRTKRGCHDPGGARPRRTEVERGDRRPGVVWIKSYISEAEGKIYCEYDAPNPQAVIEHARRAGLPADRVSEVSLEINPDMFR